MYSIWLKRIVFSIIATLFLISISAGTVFATGSSYAHHQELRGPHYDECPYYDGDCQNYPDNDGVHIQIRDRDRTRMCQ